MLRASTRVRRVLRHLPAWIAATCLLLLCFPQLLFAHELSYRNLTIYSREPLDKRIYDVLDRAESRLAASKIDGVKARIFLTNRFDVYALLSLYVGRNSFGKSYAALPTNNVFINKADAAKDLVFRSAPAHHQRSLSGVIAHEITHLWMRKRFGYWRNIAMPAWMKEGYAEYVAGESTLDFDTGLRMWKANPRDGTGYQYFKYHMLVRYLLEHDKLSVDALVDRDFDLPSLEERVLESLSRPGASR